MTYIFCYKRNDQSVDNFLWELMSCFALSNTLKNIDPPIPIHITLGPIPCHSHIIIALEYRG